MNTDTNDQSGVMRRIHKLLAMAEDGRGDPNEAAAAAAMAEKLMRKFNIEHADLLMKEIARGAGKFSTVVCSANMKRDDPTRPPLKRNPPWAGWLAYDIAKLNDCEVRYANHVSGAKVCFLGFESDAQVSGWMFDYLVSEMIRGCKLFQKSAPRTKAESYSFRRGFVMMLGKKLRAMLAEKTAEMHAAVSSRALVVSKASALAEHFGEFKYRNSSSSAPSNGAAFQAGVQAGSKVDVGRRGLSGAAAEPALRIA